ncbi:MAG TPA: DUF222 domain-containing protein [Ilumatobacteraceae bacterium]|nr:DUF222 domain-containing protein [Ilumatobacteraceae bacterium]
MEVQAIRALVEAAEVADLAACRRELADIGAVRSLLARREMEVMRRLRRLGADSEGEHSQATRSSSKSSSKAKRRADVGEAIPQLDASLAEGATTPEHVDVVAEALAGLSAGDRARVAAHGDEIRAKAADLSEGEFRRWLSVLVRRLRRDDAAARLARQKAANRASWWLDHEGMWNLRGRFDPETGALLQGRLTAATEALRKGRLPEGGPDDLLERHQWLQAQALAGLLLGDEAAAAGGSGLGMIVVMDAESYVNGEHDRTLLDACGFDLPVDTIRRWACLGSVTPVVVGVDGTQLMLGRTTRLASADQRRALRVLHPTCGCCDTPFDRCQIHHVQWWDDDGPTDITNLIPLCWRHHHLAHEGGWKFYLHKDRTLTAVRPDGSTITFPAPRVRAA